MSDPVAELIANGATRKPEAPTMSDEFGEYPHPDLFPPGRIGLIAGEQSRYTAFTQSFALAVATMPNNGGVHIAQGVDICGNANSIMRSRKEHEHWVWLLGDDHFWAQGTLCRLLARMSQGADIVVPHCLKRYPPFPPVVYSHQQEPDENGRRWRVAADLPREGLVEVESAGSAGMLIKREVLDAMEDPWFRPSFDAEGLNEDVTFCESARELGFKIWCDPAVPFGHIGTMHLSPQWGVFGDEGWDVKIGVGEMSSVGYPGVHRQIKEREQALKEEAAA